MRVLMTLFVIGVLVVSAQAQELFVFPNEDQSQDQQDKDEFQCHRLARDRTGFDPMQTPTATRAKPETQGGALRGAAGGALLGTAVGAITGDVRRGAAVGGVGGGLLGGMRRNDSRRQQDQWADEQVAIYRGDRNAYNRAFTACMESRGYTVR